MARTMLLTLLIMPALASALAATPGQAFMDSPVALVHPFGQGETPIAYYRDFTIGHLLSAIPDDGVWTAQEEGAWAYVVKARMHPTAPLGLMGYFFTSTVFDSQEHGEVPVVILASIISDGREVAKLDINEFILLAIKQISPEDAARGYSQ